MHNTGGDEAVPFQAYRQKAYFSRVTEGMGYDETPHAVCADGGKHSTLLYVYECCFRIYGHNPFSMPVFYRADQGTLYVGDKRGSVKLWMH